AATGKPMLAAPGKCTSIAAFAEALPISVNVVFAASARLSRPALSAAFNFAVSSASLDLTDSSLRRYPCLSPSVSAGAEVTRAGAWLGGDYPPLSAAAVGGLSSSVEGDS